jgi:hypothetical protein
MKKGKINEQIVIEFTMKVPTKYQESGNASQ